MKSKFAKFTFSLLLFLTFFTRRAYAVIKVPSPTSFTSLEEIINTVGSLLRPAVVIVFLAVTMYGGWLWLTARDNEEQVAKSKKVIVAGAIGFVIVALAPVIVEFVGKLLGIQGNLLDLTP
jgi:hypothetical protein